MNTTNTKFYETRDAIFNQNAKAWYQATNLQSDLFKQLKALKEKKESAK